MSRRVIFIVAAVCCAVAGVPSMAQAPNDCGVVQSVIPDMERAQKIAATAKTAIEGDRTNDSLCFDYRWSEGAAEPLRYGRRPPHMPIDNYLPENAELERLVEEVMWINLDAIALSIDDMSTMEGFARDAALAEYEELKSLCDKGFPALAEGGVKVVAAAKRAVELKRSILLANPLLKGARIVASKYDWGSRGGARMVMVNSLGSQPNNWTSQSDAKRIGYKASIVELSNLSRSENIEEKVIYNAPHTSAISDLRLHWGGERISFSQVGDEGLWNVYSMNLSEGVARSVVDCGEPDLDFFDGVELPDGRYIVNSNIGYNGVPCVNGNTGVSNMSIWDPATKNLRQITFDQDSNWGPAVMNNGRVMYTRWEYTDLTHYYTRIVMHMNPDGTENKALYGSGSMFPNSTFDIQPLPNSAAGFIGVISGHHGAIRSGRLMLFDPLKARKGAAGIVQEIPYKDRPVVEEIKDRLVDGVWPHFYKPTVINDDYFLVIAKPSARSLWGIYLVDRFDNMTCLVQDDEAGYGGAALIRESVTPPAIPDKVQLDKRDATFFIQDIYEGEGLAGVPRGTIKELRLFGYEYAYLNTPSNHDWQGIQAGWDIKRYLGTVPVEEDGSVLFTAPANTPISMQPIDENGVAAQWMRSWVVGQQGEVVSCIGCHEDQNQIVIPKRVAASMKSATPLRTPEGGVRSFTFDLEVQPILDRNCIACHDGARAFSLKGGEKDEFGFGPAYMNLMPYVRRQGGEGDMAVLRPYEYHPNTSEVVRMLKKGHHNVRLSDEEWRKFYQWIDFNAPDKGNFDDNEAHKDPYLRNPRADKSQYLRRIELKNKYADGSGVDWRKEISDYAAYLEAQGEVKPVMPEASETKKMKDVESKRFPFTATAGEKRVVEVAEGVNITFVRIPAGEFVMGSNSGEADARPESKVKINRSFWMAEAETTNEAVRALMPHDSKFVDQMWKDHVVQGYEANRDDQPAIRISYDKAMEYCRLLSEKTGLNITLPTEAQWEWACRAGSDTDFWFGEIGSDYGDKENLADKTTLKFAVTGVDPQPMKTTNPKYGHYTYLPKDEAVDDGELVMVAGKSYEANPFGLYDMHGNVAEWTRSVYAPYPYKGEVESGEYRVVRGGSYFERAKYSTSHTRKYYYPYQSVFNVGFRLVIIE